MISPTITHRIQENASPQPSRFGVEPLSWTHLSAARQTEALAIWSRLEQQIRNSGEANARIPLTASCHWTRTWLAAYGDAVPHDFLLVQNSAGPVAIALLTRGVGRRVGPFRLQTRHVGTAGENPHEGVCVEYNDLLTLPGYRAVFEELLLTFLLRDKSWGTLCLDGFPSPAVNGLLQDLPGFEIRYRESPFYDLRATREQQLDLLDPLGRSTRQNLRRLLRKYGEIDWEWADDRDHARDILSELIDLHQARWQSVGQPGAFHSPRFQRFQEQLVDQAFLPQTLQRTVVLFRARHAGETIGCLMLLVDGHRLLDYLSGFADFNVKASPGLVTHTLCMREALRRGFDAYDFLVGEKRHKANLSTGVNQLAWAAWTRTTLASRTIGILRNLKHRWRQFRNVVPAPVDPIRSPVTE